MKKQKQSDVSARESQRCILVTAADLYDGAAWIGVQMKKIDQQQSLVIGGTVAALALFTPGCASYQLGQASNPATSPERLAHFALQDDPRLTERVAANPATPVTTLLILTTSSHQATAELAAANLAIRDLSTSQIAAMAASQVHNQRLAAAYRPDTPAETLAMLAADPSPAVRACVTKNSAASYEIILGLMDDPDVLVAAAAKGSSAVLKERDARLAELQKSGLGEARLRILVAHRLPEVRAGLAAYAGLPDTLLDKLIRDDNPNVVEAAFNNADTQLLASLASDQNSTIRARVAGNKKTPGSALGQLVSDTEPHVRAALAGNTAAPHQILYKLSSDTDTSVRNRLFESATPECLEFFASESNIETRRRVAGIPRTPASALLLLAEDSDLQVRRNVLGNPSISPDVLARLSDDSDRDIRLAVAGNPSTPAAALQSLASDADAVIRKTVAANTKSPSALLHRLAGDGNENVRAAVASNPSSPASVLNVLKEDGVNSIRRLVASHRNTPGPTLMSLLEDREQSVRIAVAANPATPLDTLLSLLASASTELRNAAIGNPSVSPEALVRNIKQGAITSSDVLTMLSEHRNDGVRAAVAISANTPVSTLDRMARQDNSHLVHCAIAMNPSLTTAIADILVHGPGQLEKWTFLAGEPRSPDKNAANVFLALLKNPNQKITEHVMAVTAQRVRQYCSAACTASCIISCTSCTGCTSCTHCTGCTGCISCTRCMGCTSGCTGVCTACTGCTFCTIGT